MQHTTDKYLSDLELDDGPLVNIGTYGQQQVTLHFAWRTNQPWYLLKEEALEIAAALIAAANDLDPT